MSHDDIALGIMCKAPVAGSCKTRMCPPLSASEAAEVSRSFIADVADVIEGVQPRRGVAIYTPEGAEAAFDGLLPSEFSMLAQRGNDLGERLLHAASDLLSAGFGGVCLINSDSPTFPTALLRESIATLSQPGDRVVIVPAVDGGYCLIGVKRAHAALFQGIAWSTSQVLTQTLARIAGLGVPLSLLHAWYDVDDLGSLQLLLHELFGAGNPLAVAGVGGSPASRSRRYLSALLQTSNASRFGFPDMAPSE
jgi:rSAM/selenodomain-associated transferase 1